MNSRKNFKGKILIVDSNLDHLKLLDKMFIGQGYQVRQAINSKMALRIVNAEPPDLILLGIWIPEINGYQLCKHLKKNPKTASILVIFMGDSNRKNDYIEAFKVGGIDYLTTPFQKEEILVKIKHHLTFVQLQNQLEKSNRNLQDWKKPLSIFLNYISDGIIIADGTKKIIFLNSATTKLVGRSQKELIGKKIKLNLKLKQQEIQIKPSSLQDIPSVTRKKLINF